MLSAVMFTSQARLDFATGSNPSSVITADFNGDGYLDMAVANDSSNNVSVLLADGQGSFGAKTDFPLPANSHHPSLVAADFNGDGHVDLAVANTDRQTVSLLRGDGHGSFGIKTDLPIHMYPDSMYPDSLVAADFNDDGNMDLAVGGGGRACILAGDGEGKFWGFPDFDTGVGSYPGSLTAADFNGDGHADLATANYGSSTVSVLLGDGCFGFGPEMSFATGSKPMSVTAADFNGDGHMDLAVANNGNSTVSVLLGDGQGGLWTKMDFAVGSRPYSVAAADLNGDGHTDLAVANVGSSTVSVLLGDGEGSFGIKMDFALAPYSLPQSLAVADFNRDGHADLATANWQTGGVSVLPGDGYGGFGSFPTGSHPWSMTTADFNNDGYVDLATANGGNTLSVLLGNGHGGFTSRRNFTTGNYPVSIVAADFNGDGALDLATANNGSDTVSILLGDGLGGFGTKTDFTTGSPGSVIAADFNGDGHMDLAVGIYNAVTVLLGDGLGGFGTKTDFATGPSPCSVIAADFNGDGHMDLATANDGNYPDYNGSASVLLGDGQGGFGTHTDWVTGPSTSSVTAADFNGDGYADLAVANTGSDPDYVGSVSVLLGDGHGGFGTKTDFVTGFGSWSVVAADFDGDGQEDLAVTNPSFNSSSVSVLLGDGHGSFGTKADFATGQSFSTAAADFNGDARLDLAVANYQDSFVEVRLNLWPGDANRDGKVKFADYLTLEQNFGKSGKTWAEGDFTGDGKVSFADYLLLELNFGKSIGLPAPQPAPQATTYTEAPVETALALPAKLMAAQAPAQVASAEILQAVPAQSVALTGWQAQACRAAQTSKLHRLGDALGMLDLLAIHRQM